MAGAAKAEGYDTPPSEPPRPKILVAPPGYHVESRMRPWLVTTGGVMLGAFYGAALALSTNGGCPARYWLLVPVAGPALSANGYDQRNPPCDDPEGIVAALLIQDAIGQGIGATFLLFAFAAPQQRIVPDDIAPGVPSVSVHVVPVITPSAGGISMIGSF
jgi:hypothetical protein